MTESGTVCDTVGETFTSPAVHKDKVYFDDGLHEIIIEVSADSFSGLYLTPMITDYAYETAYTNAFSALRFALIGIIACTDTKKT